MLRVAKANLNEHLHYFNWLFATRHWMAGDSMTLADFALAAHISTLDYLGDIAVGQLGRDARLVRADQVAPGVPHAAQRPRGRACRAHAGYADLDF